MEPTATLGDQLYRDEVLAARVMTPEEKLLAGPQLFDFACRIALDGIRNQFPDVDEQLYLTTYHIRANCRTGHERGVVPDDTIALTCGADVNLNGLHVVAIAWSEAAAGSIIDFSFATASGWPTWTPTPGS